MNLRNVPHIVFMATSRSGLGHIRRVASIARALKEGTVQPRIGLFTNAAIAGLTREDMAAFDSSMVMERADMAAIAGKCGAQVVVADTMLPEGLETIAARRALILRETPDDRLGRLRLPGTNPWDLVLMPNPASHWLPSGEPGYALRMIATGWIYRRPRTLVPPVRRVPLLLVATGGGGTAETAAALAQQADAVIAGVRLVSRKPFHVAQALGPRAPEGAKLSLADGTVDPGGDLNEHFAGADAVISTAGYNSVLELAITTTPSLLMAIARTYDNQAQRAENWGGLLGRNYREEDVHGIARWLAETLEQRRRRVAIDIGPSGAGAAARAILDLLN